MKANRLVFYCDFCKKSEDDVDQIIAGVDNTAICNECVQVCVDILKEKQAEKKEADA